MSISSKWTIYNSNLC